MVIQCTFLFHTLRFLPVYNFVRIKGKLTNKYDINYTVDALAVVTTTVTKSSTCILYLACACHCVFVLYYTVDCSVLILYKS